LWGENYIRKGEAPPPEIAREGSTPSPRIALFSERELKRGSGERERSPELVMGGELHQEGGREPPS